MSMPTPLAQTPTPARGFVQRTFTDALVLSGFMDENHFAAFANEHLATLSEPEREAAKAAAARTRAAVPDLQVVPLDDVVARPAADAYLEALMAKPAFAQVFGGRPYRFAWINPAHVVAIQVFVTPRQDPVPTGAAELLRFMLPDRWEVPAEISFIPPLGPIQIVTSSPQLGGLQARLEADGARIVIEPAPHINLVQVMHFSGRYYLRNGYHRVFDAIRTGIAEIPAIVVDALQPADLELNLGNAAFNVGYTIGLARPPLVADFATPAAHVTRIRVRRYGVSVTLQVSPLNVGI